LKDSNSIVALSVSHQHVTFFNFITTLFNQVATVPSVIVSLSRGMVTITTPSGKAAGAVDVVFFFVASGVVGALFSV
jgi:hypothetical protein